MNRRLSPRLALLFCALAACKAPAGKTTPPSRSEGAPRILMIATSHARLGESGEQTGIWLEELAAPLRKFVSHGAEVDIASPAGGEIPVDPRSKTANTDASKWFYEVGDGAKLLTTSIKIADIKGDYDAYFVVGGHGAMWDLPNTPELAALLSKAYENNHVVAAVCHGPAALVNVQVHGEPLVKDKRVTAFTNDEEAQVKLEGVVPFSLQDKLIELGAKFERRPEFTPNAIADDHLVTGQNPASSVEAADLVLTLLDSYRAVPPAAAKP
ncbi:MAG TPA: type 1 glutamine amidotransferase domain-containing protein [Polyangiales bacterium]